MGKQFDYENQAWYEDTTGTYIKCGHPSTMDCGCFGKLHEGEKVTGYLEMNEIFDTVEELAGIYPDSDSLRNAIHAIITKQIYIDVSPFKKNKLEASQQILRTIGSSTIIRNVEHLARTYEHARGISMRIGG